MGAVLSCYKSTAGNERRNWSQMLPEIMELISDRLPLVDFIRFRSVCRDWRLAPSGRSEVTSFSKESPWLMFYGFRNKCYFYSHSHPKSCSFILPELEGATIMESKFGWFLAHHNGCFFLYYCFTRTKIDLPKHIVTSDQACTFTTLPTSRDCTVFIVSRRCDSALEVSSCRIGDSKWKVVIVKVSKDQIGTIQAVHCCNCPDSYTQCTCVLVNKIGIYADEYILVYDYVESRCIWYTRGEKTSSEMSSQTSRWFDEVKTLHGRDWWHKFGERGILISMSAHSFSVDNIVGACRQQMIHADASEHESSDADQLNEVTAAWISPWIQRTRNN